MRRLGGLDAGARGLPHPVRHQPGPAGQDQGRNISRGALLPAGRGHREAAAACANGPKISLTWRASSWSGSRAATARACPARRNSTRRCFASPGPGNVRQLKNVMERLTALHPGGVLEPEDIEEDCSQRRCRLPIFPACRGKMRGNNIWRALSLLMRKRAGALRRKCQRGGARSRGGPQDVLRAAQAGPRTSRWGIHSPIRARKRGIDSPDIEIVPCM